MDRAILTLQQHFGNTGRAAKIPVDLEGWTNIEQVGISSAIFVVPPPVLIGRFNQMNLVGQLVIGMVSILETGPEVDFPAHRPAG